MPLVTRLSGKRVGVVGMGRGVRFYGRPTDAQVEGRHPFPVPQTEVLATLAAFEGALHSMRTGRSVTLEPG